MFPACVARAQIATGTSSGGAAAPAVGGTGQASSAPSVGSISSPSSGGTSPAAPGTPATNGNSNGSGSAASGNGNGATSGNTTSSGSGSEAGAQPNSGNPLAGNGPVTLTLPQIVNIVIGNNTAVIEARQRLQLAVEQINQLNAQEKPQLRADAADTYNSYAATTTTLGPTVQNPVLPSGGTIPTITDQAAASISSLSSPTSISGTVAPGVSSSASFGPAGPAGGVGGGGAAAGTGASSTGSGGVGAGSSTASSTPGTSTASGGNSSSTPSAPTTSGTSASGAAGNAGTGAGNGNGNGSPASNGASSGQSGAANGTAGEGSTGAGDTGTSGTDNGASGNAPGEPAANGANASGKGANAAGTSGASGTTSGGTGNTGTSGQGTSTAAPGNDTSGMSGSSTGTGSGGAGDAGVSYIAPQEQLAAMPAILQAYLTADGGGSDDADEIAQATQTRPAPAALTSADVVGRAGLREQPQATGTGTGTGTTTGTTGITTVEAERNTYSARATGSQYIDLFGYFPAARDVQNSIRDFYLLDLERIENETALVAKSTFFNVLYAQAEFAVEQEQVNYAAENVRITTDRRGQGVAADYDVLTAETALANAQQLFDTARNQLQLADSQLSYLVGINPDRPVTLVDPVAPPLNQAFNLPQSEQVALQRRPEVRQAQKNVNIANRLVKLAGATLAPTLGIVGVAQYNSTLTEFAPHSLATISAQLGVPISDGGATRSRVRSAKIDLQTQQVNLGSLQLSVGLEVRQAILNINDAQSRVSTAQVAVSQAEEARRLSVVRYENGLGTLLDLTNAVAQLATAQSNLADADFSYETALATLVRNEGGR